MIGRHKNCWHAAQVYLEKLANDNFSALSALQEIARILDDTDQLHGIRSLVVSRPVL
jgi:hypothetical protein